MVSENSLLKRILHVVGARPNFMKIAPIMHEMAKHPDCSSSRSWSTPASTTTPTCRRCFSTSWSCPSRTSTWKLAPAPTPQQTAQIMQRFEPVLLDYKPDWVIVPGDVNSTLACALVASKLGVKVAHVEAGLRSFDRTMPEEINRLVTDQLADLLFTPSRDGDENLLREGIPAEKIRFVGNVMIDTLVRLLPKAEARWPELAGAFRPGPLRAGDAAPPFQRG